MKTTPLQLSEIHLITFSVKKIKRRSILSQRGENWPHQWAAPSRAPCASLPHRFALSTPLAFEVHKSEDYLSLFYRVQEENTLVSPASKKTMGRPLEPRNIFLHLAFLRLKPLWKRLSPPWRCSSGWRGEVHPLLQRSRVHERCQGLGKGPGSGDVKYNLILMLWCDCSPARESPP